MKKTIFQNITLALFIAVVPSATISLAYEGLSPIANAGLPRYAAQDPVILDGTGSYDPDESGPLSYEWHQLTGPSVEITDATTATPTISGFVQTDEIQECEFELIVNDGEQISLPDTVKVIIVPDFGDNTFQQENPPFDPKKPTMIYFGGGDCVNGLAVDCASPFTSAWLDKANIINFRNGYRPNSGTGERTYYRYGDMIIVYLSSVAPYYKQPIQTSGWSTGGQPAIDIGIRLNLTYGDTRYAINRVTFFDATRYCRDYYSESITLFLGSSVDGEQCWVDSYVSATSGGGGFVVGASPYHENVLNVCFPTATGSWYTRHVLAKLWYNNSARLVFPELSDFNHGVVAGSYWSVIGPGKNLQLASTPSVEIFKFAWNGSSSSGNMDFDDESNYPGRLPEPVTLIGPEDGSIVDVNGAVFSCEVSENAIGYQLLFGPDPYRVMDYYVISDTPNPPSEAINSSPFEQTWWTVKAYDQYGSTIYADPILANFESLDPPLVQNITLGKRYGSVRHAIVDARNGHEIVVSSGVYQGNINFRGKNLTVRSTNPNDSTVVASTILTGDGNGNLVTFSGGEDENCVLAGFTIINANNGIYCSGSSPTITNCSIVGNVGDGIKLYLSSNPTISNCIIADNIGSGIIMLKQVSGRKQFFNSPTIANCTIVGNSEIGISEGIPSILNSIISDNGVQITGSSAIVTYSNVQGGFPGEGNIDADPLFADASNDDFHLLTGSPCIDAGDPSASVGLEPEPNGGIINMGAYGGTSEASKSP
jgi:parallel beta-helix repeat protein